MSASGREKEPELPLALLPEGHRSFAPSLYRELHKLAARKMRLERVGHTLQPTALLNEAYIRLAEASDSVWQDRAHFLAAAAHVMRHVLVDHARARRAGKRGGIQNQITLDENILPAPDQSIDILALHEALERLAELDPRQGRIVELHFFGGLSFEEIALVLQLSERTVKREWAMARIWLFKKISS